MHCAAALQRHFFALVQISILLMASFYVHTQRSTEISTYYIFTKYTNYLIKRNSYIIYPETYSVIPAIIIIIAYKLKILVNDFPMPKII